MSRESAVEMGNGMSLMKDLCFIPHSQKTKERINTESERNLAYYKPSKSNLGIHILDVKEKAFLYRGGTWCETTKQQKH